MSKEQLFITQIKQNVIKNLKEINLSKKDRDFLLDLIKLFDILAKNPKDEFINTLILLIEKAERDQEEELNIRLRSLNTQLEKSKFTEIKHFPNFSLYFKKEKVDIYIKKISSNWDLLIKEIKKIDFTQIRVIVYKTVSKKEKILNKIIKNSNIKENSENWSEKLIDIIENNICINIHIILDLKKEELN